MTGPLIPTLKSELSRLCPGESRYLVAVSGGIDSAVLMRGMAEVCAEKSLEIVVAHYYHQWRPESEQDAIFVMEEAAEHGFSCQLGRSEIPPIDSEKTESLAREQRYEFLRKTALKQKCPIILMAHTADDQVETVLHHLLRGTGLSGLTGMNPIRELDEEIRLVRPMLTIPRPEVERYAAKHGVVYREDDTNRSLEYTRNLIRHEVLKWLESQGFDSTRESILRLSQQAGDVQASLEWVVEDILSRVVVSSSVERVELSIDALREVPRHLQREVFVALWKRNHWPRQNMGFSEWERLAELIETGDRFHLPGKIDCRQKRGKIILQRE